MTVDLAQRLAREETDELVSWYSYNDRNRSVDAFDGLTGHGTIEKLAYRLEIGHFRHNETILASTFCRRVF